MRATRSLRGPLFSNRSPSDVVRSQEVEVLGKINLIGKATFGSSGGLAGH